MSEGARPRLVFRTLVLTFVLWGIPVGASAPAQRDDGATIIHTVHQLAAAGVELRVLMPGPAETSRY